MPRSMSFRSISCGGRKKGGWKALMMRIDSGERSSSTTARLARCRLSGMLLAAVWIPRVKAQTISSTSATSRYRLRSSLMPRLSTLPACISGLLFPEQRHAQRQQHRQRDGQGQQVAGQVGEAQRLGEHPAADDQEVRGGVQLADDRAEALQG